MFAGLKPNWFSPKNSQNIKSQEKKMQIKKKKKDKSYYKVMC